MEYIAVDSYDPIAGETDDLGNGAIYLALVKRFIYRLVNTRYSVATVDGKTTTSSIDGACIPNTGFITGSSRAYLPVIFISPGNRDMESEIDTQLRAASSGTENYSNCTIGSFFQALIVVIRSISVARWDTFATWFRDGSGSGSYVDMLNDSNVDGCNITGITLIGDEFDGGQGITAPRFSNAAEFFQWVYDMLPSEFKDQNISSIRHPDINSYYWMSIFVEGLGGTYESYTGWTNITIALEIRL